MPIPYENPAPEQAHPDLDDRAYRRVPQSWALEQMQFHHDEVLRWLGEYTIFVLRWRVEDHDAGLVTRCSTCWMQDEAVAEAYGQSTDRECPDCLGTTFDGGYKALLYRPAMWDVTEPSNQEARRGEVERQTSSIQTTSDFRVRKGDWCLRGDGTRWRIETTSTNRLRTGFDVSGPQDAVGFNMSEVHLVDNESPAHLIDPTDESTLIDRLDVATLHWPVDFSAYEVIRGSLF